MQIEINPCDSYAVVCFPTLHSNINRNPPSPLIEYTDLETISPVQNQDTSLHHRDFIIINDSKCLPSPAFNNTPRKLTSGINVCTN